MHPYTVSELDPFSTEFLSDPHPFHEQLREAGPVVRLERYGIWAIARHEQVHAVLGEKVLLFLAAANRDPRRWDQPERFDIRRQTLGHVGFGNGIHGCVGQAVAWLEGEIVLDALARRVESIELNGEPRLLLNNTLRGWASLPVVVRSASR